jgi:hypothetical protein
MAQERGLLSCDFFNWRGAVLRDHPGFVPKSRAGHENAPARFPLRRTPCKEI